jgi:hypothetical protein
MKERTWKARKQTAVPHVGKEVKGKGREGKGREGKGRKERKRCQVDELLGILQTSIFNLELPTLVGSHLSIYQCILHPSST